MINGKYYENDFEEAFVQLLQDAGWQYSYGESIVREQTSALLGDDMTTFLHASYPDLTAEELARCVANLRNTTSTTEYLTARTVFRLYQDGFTLTRDDMTKPDMHVDYIDFDTPDYNLFRAVNQFTMREGKEERRPDVLLFVNGIPVCIIELKNPADEHATIWDAWQQIHVRYRRDIPSLTKYCALSCISDAANTRLGTPFSPFKHYYAWKKVDNADERAMDGVAEMKTLIAGAFTPDRLLSILRDFVYFPDVQKDKEDETEVVCRYPQYFATLKLEVNILNHLRSAKGGDGKGGTYFGATGCGKTYTMLFLARRLALRAKSRLGSPTILIIVDREDLQTQTGELFCASKDFLNEPSTREIENREDLKNELSARESGGVFVMTIQKFCEDIGFLSDRTNIICFSDEAHRTQTSVGEKLNVYDKPTGKKGKMGAFVTYGFAYHLRTAFPKATFVGFTGTPIDDTIHVFGDVVDYYTMNEAVADGITVPLKYVARLARVNMDEEKAKLIEKYYEQCAEEGTDADKIEKSKSAMSSLNVILGEDGRLEKVAKDIADHYDQFVANQSASVVKAMVVCSDRKIAFNLYNKFKATRPDWFVERRVPDESIYQTPEEKAELEKIKPLPMMNLVATQGSNDEKALYDLCGTKAYRKMLDTEFKKEKSNFRIAIVVDMWITGFDVPSLTILYNDKPLQRHTLIQTISRVNRKFEGKEFGLIMDYIGIRENMKKSMKQYGGGNGGGGYTDPDDLETTYQIFLSELDELNALFDGFDNDQFFSDNPIMRLNCLQQASEFVLTKDAERKDDESCDAQKKKLPGFRTRFKGHVRRLKMAYDICQPAGRLQPQETALAQFYMAVQSMVSKVIGDGKDVMEMNREVESMVGDAINCPRVEKVLNGDEEIDIFGEEFLKEIEDVKQPRTKFQLLVQAIKRVIKEYAKINRVKSKQFEEMLQAVIDEYNQRDNLTFTNDVAADTVNAVQDVVETKLQKLSDQIKSIFDLLNKDKAEFKEMGITFEEKAFYDILVEVRDKYKFEYADDRCISLAKKIKQLIDKSSVYANWLVNDNIRAHLSFDLAKLIYKEGYPPQWDEEVFEKVMAQVKDFKTYNS